jgi:hypothetical protein
MGELEEAEGRETHQRATSVKIFLIEIKRTD